MPVELCLANKERYVGDMTYESHGERCANHSLPCDIEYKSHVERCAYDVEYESERKAEEERGVKFSWEETITHLAKKVESVDIKNVDLEVDESSLQEFSVQELVDEESMLGAVPLSLCNRRSESSLSSDESASVSEFSEFTVTGSTETFNTAELADLYIEELEDEVSYGSLINFIGHFECSVEPLGIVAQELGGNKAAVFNIWGSDLIQELFELQARGVLISPNEVELSSVPPEIAIAGSLEIAKDTEIWICETGASNHLAFAKVGCSVEPPSKAQSQRISGLARKAESEIDIPSIVCDCFGNELTKVTLKEVSYKGDSNFNFFSVGRCLVDGWKLSGDADYVHLSKGGVDIKFDIVIRTKNGCVVLLFDQE